MVRQSLQNVSFGRRCLNNICIQSYPLDLPQKQWEVFVRMFKKY
ncbi:hypothetical protein HMPREF0673_02638 [Leyella stercorea DSM 18206]|uniref:Uncharacterized protein n=1 Tax=Leyella stercorea DSM 18206 TaxID=1002367 RepID=G6B168_9BACT|nr:hypothetical protein HMPREF0673_02638 [Leyella stercorea DSM 18206]